MAITTGFFDATYDSETKTYDRAYNSASFTEYFGEILGSGVCVYGNDDSMLVSASGTTVTVADGFLFINGYWLKNSADYTISMAGLPADTYAIVARLDLTGRNISISYEPTAAQYTDALVLAYVTVSSGGTLSVADTRADTSVCGLIDAAGSLSQKVSAALDYINNNVPAAFSELTETITAEAAAQSAAVQAEISSVNSTVEAKSAEVDAALQTLPEPAVGEIEFSAAGAKTGWLQCDGRYISAANYPELVEVLGKVSPGTGAFVVRSNGEVGRQISNGYIYNGRMWVYSHSTRTLYGVSLTGASIVSIPVTSSSDGFSALVSPATWPICLSIAGGYLFLSQIRGGGTSGAAASSTYVTLLSAAFSGNESALTLADVFSSYGSVWVFGQDGMLIPYVQMEQVEGANTFAMCIGVGTQRESYGGKAYVRPYIYYWKWGLGDTSPIVSTIQYFATEGSYSEYQSLSRQCIAKFSFNKKNQGEMVAVTRRTERNTYGEHYWGNYVDRKSAMRGIYTSAYTYKDMDTYVSVPDAIMTEIVGGTDTLIALSIGTSDCALTYYRTDSGAEVTQVTLPLALPSASAVFADAAVYCSNKSMWFIFVGTGIIFTNDLADAEQYGFLNTTETLGALTNFSYMDYDEATSTLVIVGQDGNNAVKVATLDLSGWTYSDTGAYLPTLSSGGIPAYIKAVSS